MNPTIEAMQKYGGGFVRKLAEAWIAADPQNRATLEAAFPELFWRYAQMVPA